jgi:hypothetical protein
LPPLLTRARLGRFVCRSGIDNDFGSFPVLGLLSHDRDYFDSIATLATPSPRRTRSQAGIEAGKGFAEGVLSDRSPHTVTCNPCAAIFRSTEATDPVSLPTDAQWTSQRLTYSIIHSYSFSSSETLRLNSEERGASTMPSRHGVRRPAGFVFRREGTSRDKENKDTLWLPELQEEAQEVW